MAYADDPDRTGVAVLESMRSWSSAGCCGSVTRLPFDGYVGQSAAPSLWTDTPHAHNVHMSYGVIASKTGQMSVESIDGDGGEDGTDSDVTLERFQSVWGSVWVPGRLTLTKLHLNFIPTRGGRGMAMMDINLRDVDAVELSGGRMSRQIGLRTGRHLARIRIMGAPGLATQIAELAEAARECADKPLADPPAGSSTGSSTTGPPEMPPGVAR